MTDAAEEYRNEVNARIARNIPVIEEYRSTGGVLRGSFSGMHVVLLHHIGARSGNERVSPVVYRDLGKSIAVFGANGGRTRHPDWSFNLVAHPNTIIERGATQIPVRARVATGDERREVWEAQKTTDPVFAEFERTALREIPVVILDRR